MRVVLDTNILIAAFISPKGFASRVLDLWIEGEYTLVTSSWQVDEFKRVSRYDRVKKRVEPHEIGTFVNVLRDHAIVIENLPSIDVSPDPDDNPMIATALAGGAQYLVSRDKSDVLNLEIVTGVRILTLREFIELFGMSETGRG
jgi:uncharacterized protein